MRKLFVLFSLIMVLVSCDNGGESNYTPSSSYSQPSTRTVYCSYCNGGGIVINPYDGNYYYCQNCGGSGVVTVSTIGSNPSFTGTLNCTKCDCPGWAGSPTHGGKCGRKLRGGKVCEHTYTDHRTPGE